MTQFRSVAPLFRRSKIPSGAAHSSGCAPVMTLVGQGRGDPVARARALVHGPPGPVRVDARGRSVIDRHADVARLARLYGLVKPAQTRRCATTNTRAAARPELSRVLPVEQRTTLPRPAGAGRTSARPPWSRGRSVVALRPMRADPSPAPSAPGTACRATARKPWVILSPEKSPARILASAQRLR